MTTREHFDAVVIGSGFGGSVMAYRFAEAGKRVCLLERGKRYPPGSFARSPKEMSANFWDPSEGHYGLFQIWKFAGTDGIVSAGLGGGSLIYANVFIRKDERWFYRRNSDGTTTDWPITRADLDSHYDRVRNIIGLQRFPLEHAPYSATPKTRALQEAATNLGLEWFTPDLAVTFGDPGAVPAPGEPIFEDGSTINNLHRRTRYTCRLCGECDIGCNFGSKNTLDYTYLTLAERLHAELRDHCEVRSFAPEEGGRYVVRYVHHDPTREGVPTNTAKLPLVEVTTDRLVLSAGTFGSGFLMLKNQANFPGLSPQLGKFFSGNGDYLGLLLDAKEEVEGESRPRALNPSRGSVITSTIRVPDSADGGSGPGYYVQDGGYPGFVDWLAEASNVPGSLHRGLRFLGNEVLGWVHGNGHSDIDDRIEELIGDAHTSAGILPLLAMGLDTPGGEFSLDREEFLELTWASDRSAEYFDRAKGTMRAVAEQLNARFQEDPVGYVRHKVITVHPVGGCAMGTSPGEGLVNEHGEVFGYPNFVIADASVMPGPVGPNPSFTIAALSDRFADRLVDP
jgi:cholesterol oxidase